MTVNSRAGKCCPEHVSFEVEQCCKHCPMQHKAAPYFRPRWVTGFESAVPEAYEALHDRARKMAAHWGIAESRIMFHSDALR